MTRKSGIDELFEAFGITKPKPHPTPQPDTYSVSYRCGNCGVLSNIRFTQGVVAPDGAIKCPRCGTRRTTKVL